MEDEVLTEYELERARRIEQNNEKLAEIGVPRLSTLIRAPPAVKRSRAKKRPTVEPEGGRRRSARLDTTADPSSLLFLDALPDHEDDYDAPRKPARPPKAPRPPSDGPPAPRPQPAAGSSRAMQARVDEVQAACLGRQLPPPDGSGAMKATVMARLRGSAAPPAFNKYSGIQEWINSVTLFVNLYGDSYKNGFLENGRRMTWFGQKGQESDHPAIIRILSARALDGSGGVTGGNGGTGGAGGGGKSGDGGSEGAGGGAGAGEGLASTGPAPTVMLFCRGEGAPYVYCGRVRCAQLYEGTQPLRLELELLDFDAANKHLEFSSLIGSAAGVNGASKKIK